MKSLGTAHAVELKELETNKVTQANVEYLKKQVCPTKSCKELMCVNAFHHISLEPNFLGVLVGIFKPVGELNESHTSNFMFYVVIFDFRAPVKVRKYQKTV